MGKHECTRCEKEFDNDDALRKHVGRKHKISAENFYVEYKLNCIRPTCACRCGEEVKFNTWQRGFSSFVPGHQNRVNNPMSGNTHTHETRAKIAAARQGKSSWCAGLTKESDARIASAAKKASETIMTNKSLREHRSRVMRENRHNGTIPTLLGADHSQWKGGTSHIRELTRRRKAYCQWHDARRAANNYRCNTCGVHEHDVKNSTLDVHHDVEEYATIVNKFVDIMNPLLRDDFDIKSRIADMIAQYHIDADVSGIPLCRDCHRKLHGNLNFKD